VLEPEALRAALAPGDILVSMYPSDWHQRLAELALSRGAHFISSSYKPRRCARSTGPRGRPAWRW
jgi:hypothetical protein